nr:hypothetical protein [Tanacetum cinerariifolium]
MVKFGNDQIAPILGYGDLVQGAVTIKRVYYVEGLNHNLFLLTGKPTTFSNSFIRKDFSKSTSVTKNNVSNDFSKPVTAQTLPTKKKSCLKNMNVLAPGMYKIHIDHNQARTSKLPKDSKQTNKRVSFSTGVIPTTSVSRPQLKSNPHGDRVLYSNSHGKKLEVEEHRGNVKLSKNKTSITACNDSLNAKTLNEKSISAMCAKCVMIVKHDLCVPKSVAKPIKKTAASESIKKPRNNLIEIVLFIVDSRCSKHMTGNLKLLINFVEKFMGTTLHAYFAVEGIHHQMSVARTPKQNGVVERRNRTLVEAARTMLSATKVPLFFWDEAIATACFTQNHSLIIPRHEKTPCHIINDRKPSVKFFHIFGSVCYIVRDGENLDKMKEKGDECIFVGYSTQSRAYIMFNKRTRVIMEYIHVNFDELPQMASDQLSSDPALECQSMALNLDSLSPAIQRQANVPQADRTVTMSNELDFLFSLMFDELLNGSSKVVSKSSTVSAADAPYQRQYHTTPLNIHTAHVPTCQVPTLAPTVISSENINQAETYAKNDQIIDDEFINIFSTPVQDQGEMSLRHVDSLNMHTFYQRYPSEHRWTKDHPLEQVIRNPSESVRTRRQLESDTEMCMFALTVSRTEHKNIKEAMADSSWIESMQEELHQFDLLDVWELVDRPLCTNVINLKWLWKNKLIPRHEKTPYHIINERKLSVKFFHIFGFVCYIVRDRENLDKMKEKGDECIFVGYSTQSRAYRVFNKRTRVIMESIHVNFDELPQMALAHNSSDPAPTCQKMASVQISSNPAPECQAMALEHDSLSPGPKYAQEILGKHGMTSCDGIGTPMATKHLDADLSGTPVDKTKYRSKVGALMYLTASRPDIMHATCYCARYQAQPTEKHLTTVKRIFRYLKDTIHMGL